MKLPPRKQVYMPPDLRKVVDVASLLHSDGPPTEAVAAHCTVDIFPAVSDCESVHACPDGVQKDVDLNTIREFGAAHMKRGSDLNQFVAQVSSQSVATVVQFENRIRILRDIYPFKNKAAATQMCSMLNEYFDSTGLMVRVTCED